MAVYSTCIHLVTLCVLSITLSSSISNAIDANPTFRLKAVNLGGWLVTEGWIKPHLFDDIVNNHFLDGTSIQLKSLTTGKYLSAESGGGTTIVANRLNPSNWETFKLWRIDENTFNIRVSHKQFFGVDERKNVVAISTTASEKFTIVRETKDGYRVRIKGPNGNFLQAKTENLVTADGLERTDWSDSDRSVFNMTIVKTLKGEYQLTNGLGPIKAPQVMKEHWSTFIVEDDFNFIASNGVNGVRIPVGWWITMDNPPSPFVGGSLQALDNAFSWAEKCDLKVIIDLHAAPGSQNMDEHSGTRDGSLEWGEDYIQETLDVIEFLTQRYAKRSSLYAVELMNEPHAPGVSLETLTKYYEEGYHAVRKHSDKAYVVMSNRLNTNNHKELLPLANRLVGSVIDVHYYNLFSDYFKNMNVQQNIDYVNINRRDELNEVNLSNGPPIFVGEWVAEWEVNGATKEDYQRFADAQLKLYGEATFGWAYWTLKHVYEHWSMTSMIKQSIIKL